jgi:hypothetical protein
VAQVKGVDYD